MTKPQKANRLLKEPSPYLQQHAHNPVDWYPWGQEAFDKALQENKPILLSIGYAACHWCHVMAHESFEDENTAKLMNELFINIKVDKEERPDLDKIYQTSHYLLSQQTGGWPLTIFLTPERIPFYSGTYFPKEEHPQLPAFKRVLQIISDFYHKEKDKVNNQTRQLEIILNQQESVGAETLSKDPLEKGLKVLVENYDAKHGGFGHGPKFPQVSRLEYLLRSNSPLAFATLKQMAEGGIYDQLGGGFFRYTVDEAWNIPHFEKMLYDNGQLLTIYALAWKHYSESSFKTIAYETADFAIKHFQAENGGFYASFDADSEGVEGKFYRWTREEVAALLTEEEFAFITLYFGLDKAPNFEGYWHFYLAQSMDFICEQLKIPKKKAERLLASSKTKLLHAREQRVSPFRDEKILTSWSSLMIKGLLLTGASLKEDRFIKAGHKTLDFIQKNLWKNNKLYAAYKDGKPYLDAYLDDYAFLLDSLMGALQTSWKTEYLDFAIQLAEEILNSFADPKGGFFFTASQHEKLLYRPKVMMDDALPAGNGVLLRSFLILGYLLAEPRYLNAAEKILESSWPILKQYPAEHCSLLIGLKDYLNPPPLIVLRGDKDEIKLWQEELSINDYSFAIPKEVSNLPESLAQKTPQGKACAYLCRGMSCEAVIKR